MLKRLYDKTFGRERKHAAADHGLSRREWLGKVSVPALGAAAGLSLTGNAFASERPNAVKDDHLGGARVYNIRDFGAKGDGKTLDTKALQTAIDKCTAESGGTVLVPAGLYPIGTVELKSNVRLYLSAQAVLLGTDDGKQYYAAKAIPLSGDSTLGDGNVGLLFAVKADNIVIEGPGLIDGQGRRFRGEKKGDPSPAGISGPQRPYHLLFYQCSNLTVRDIRLKDSAFHSVRVIQCEFAKFDGLHIRGKVIHNNDGFHFISSKYVHVTNCDVQSQDDACALFGSCKFFTISNCSFSTRWSVFRFGGGEAEDIAISNCLIYETYGCPIKMRCGPGSRFENISFSNIVMRDVTGPISVGLGSQSNRPGGSNEPGVVRNISFSNIRATVVKPVPLRETEVDSKYNPGEEASCVTLNAMDNVYLENITFNDVHITFPGGGTAEQAAVRDVPKIAGEYYQIGVPPAYGIYARNVRSLSLQNVTLAMTAPDLRPALVLDHSEGAAINGLSANGHEQAESVCRIINSSDVLFSATRVTKAAHTFLQLEGANSRIRIDGGDLSRASATLSLANGARADMIKIKD